MCDLNFLLRLMSTLSIEVLHKKWSGYLWIRKLRCKSRKVLNCLSIYNKKQRLESRSLQWWIFRGPSKVKVLSSIFRLVTKLRMIISRLRPEASYRYQQGHPFFPFGVECVSLYSVGSVGRSVGLKKRKTEKRKKITGSLWIGGLIPQHHCYGAWKQQDMNSKEYGRNVGWCYCSINPLTPKIWLLILPSICFIFTSNLVMRIWC